MARLLGSRACGSRGSGLSKRGYSRFSVIYTTFALSRFLYDVHTDLYFA